MRFLLGIVVFIAATVLAWFAVMIGYGIVTELIGYRDFEGATAMGVAFIFGPFIAILSGLITAAWFLQKGSSRQDPS